MKAGRIILRREDRFASIERNSQINHCRGLHNILILSRDQLGLSLTTSQYLAAVCQLVLEEVRQTVQTATITSAMMPVSLQRRASRLQPATFHRELSLQMIISIICRQEDGSNKQNSASRTRNLKYSEPG